MDNVRQAAMLTLYNTEFEGAYVNMAVKETLNKNKDFSKKDKAFLTSIVYGVIKYRITLDYIIKTYSKIKLKKLSPYILTILRMGIYQLKFMDKVPESAAVNESVNLSKRYGHKASAGFVNGVLRNVSKNEIKYPKEREEYLEVKYSFPRWIIKKWIDAYGEEFTIELMEAMNREVQVSLRVNDLKITKEELLGKLPFAKSSPLHPLALVSEGFDIGASDEYKAGEFIAQDISAMFASTVLSPNEGETVLDICAAPGGKTTHLAQIMKNKGKIIACDIHEHKIEIIKENAKRMGISIIDAKKADALVINDEFLEKFDKVLVDVPCSGLGIIRRKPDIKLKKEETDITEIQYKILENASKYLKPGGELLYSTCTLNKDENEEIVNRFLKEHTGYEFVDIEGFLPQNLKKEEAKGGYITFYPNVDGIDGFFISKIKRCKND